MTGLFRYPAGSLFGRTVPKSKIYAHSHPSSAVQNLFVQQVDRIIWQCKLAPETIHLPGTAAVPEIQIFGIDLREPELDAEVLHGIDAAIPFPIFFELHYGVQVRPAAAYKRPSAVDSTKWVIGRYFAGDWLPADAPRPELPVALDLDVLYARLITPLLPYPALPGEGLAAQVARMERLRSCQQALQRCEARLRKEGQANLRVAINAERRKLLHDIANLLRPSKAGERIPPAEG